MMTLLRSKWAGGPAATQAWQLKEAKRKKDERTCRHDLPRYGRAKTRLRKAYVAAESFGKQAF
jgi:hypothetical protein